MNKQISLSNLEDELSQVRTKKKEFLEQIERIVPWNEWVAMIKPCYYKGERGNKPYDLELMLRLYLIQNLYNLADEATVAEVTDSSSRRLPWRTAPLNSPSVSSSSCKRPAAAR